MNGWLTRRRLDVPEVHALLAAVDRLVDGWAETEPGTRERRDLWLRMTRAANALGERAYGGPTLADRIHVVVEKHQTGDTG